MEPLGKGVGCLDAGLPYYLWKYETSSYLSESPFKSQSFSLTRIFTFLFWKMSVKVESFVFQIGCVYICTSVQNKYQVYFNLTFKIYIWYVIYKIYKLYVKILNNKCFLSIKYFIWREVREWRFEFSSRLIISVSIISAEEFHSFYI